MVRRLNILTAGYHRDIRQGHSCSFGRGNKIGYIMDIQAKM